MSSGYWGVKRLEGVDVGSVIFSAQRTVFEGVGLASTTVFDVPDSVDG